MLGPEGCGKYLAVTELAKQLRLPRSAIVTLASDDSSIGIAQLQELNRQLALKNADGASRIVIVRDADAMTVEAQNAFLKLLEEPPLDTAIFLIASNRSLLLPTIISRCRLINFPAFVPEQITDYLKQNYQLSPTVLDQIASLCGGSLGTAINLATDAELLAIHTTRQQLIEELLSANLDLYQKLARVGKIEGEADASAVIEDYLQLVRLKLRQTSNQEQMKHYTHLLNRGSKLLEQLRANSNPRLVLTQLAMEAGSD